MAEESGTQAPPMPDSVASGSEEAFSRAARNTAARAVGEVLGKLASLVLFAAVARSLGESGLGVFVLALAWAEISMMISSLGLDRGLIRWVAEDRSRAGALLGNTLAIKLVLAIPVIGALVIAATVVGYGHTTQLVIYILTLGALFDALARILFSTFNGFERSELIAVCLIFQRFAAAGLGIAVLAAGFGVVSVSITYTVASGMTLALAAVLLRRRLQLRGVELQPAELRALARRSIPFSAQDIFTVLLFKLDAVLLSLMAAAAAVGRYGSAYRLFEATFFLTYAVGGAFAPMYTYLGPQTEPTLAGVFQRSIKLALALLLPCAVAFGVLPEWFSRTLFGDRLADAAPPLQLLAPVVVLIGLVTLSTSLLVSRGNPSLIVRLSAVMLVLNAALNLALIPELQDRGAALAMLVTEVVFLAVAFRWAVRAVAGRIDWLSMLAAPLGGGAAMGLCTYLLRPQPGLALVAGLVAYAAGFLLTERRTGPEDLEFATRVVAGRLRRGAAPSE